MYIPRDIESTIRRLERDYPVLTILGPRQSGKTSLVRHLYPDYTYVNLEDAHSHQLAEESVDEFFKVYEPPMVIDEIQRSPRLLGKIQLLTDESGQKATQFILTVSQEIHIQGHISQSLAGRTALFHVLPLSVREMKASGKWSSDRDELLLKGSYPKVWAEELSSPFHYYQNYISTYIQKDVKQIVAIKDERVFYLFLKLLAGRVGNLLNILSLANDLGVARNTIERWLSVLEASHVIQLLQPWAPRRTGSLTKTPKLYFCDTALVCALLDITTADQMLRDPLRGSVFENYCIMEAIKQRANSASPTNLFFFRDSYGMEVDLLFEQHRQVIPYEIKSGDRYTKEQLGALRRFGDRYAKYLSSEQSGGLIYAGAIKTEVDGYHITPFTTMEGLFLD